MPLLGSAALLLSFDVLPEHVAEHDRWHTHEHLAERLSLPGFLRGSRWVASHGESRYMVLYEVESLDALESPAYLARLNQPSPWTARVMPHYRGMRRGLCDVLGSVGSGQAAFAAIFRFAPAAHRAEPLHRQIVREVLPRVAGAPGLLGAHLLRGARIASATEEQRIRGTDGAVATALIVAGYDAGAVAAWVAELARPTGEFAADLEPGVPAFYRLACSLSHEDLRG